MSKWMQRKPRIKYHTDDSIIDKLLKIRGVISKDEFLNPSDKFLNDPYLLKNMDIIIKIIIESIKHNKKIAVSFDVDTDGCTAGAILYRYLKHFTDNIYYTYHQRSFGHGIENQLKQITNDTDLVVILDSSTSSVEACKTLTENGKQVIIIDHHPSEMDNPYAVIVNPQLDDYPNKSISGAGLAYKVCQLLDEKLGVHLAENYIDLCAIGMIGDVMDVSVPENRYLMIQGMKNIQNQGIKTILDLAKVKLSEVNSDTISYTIVPQINGAARLNKIEIPIRLLLSDDKNECLELAKQLKELNEQRKETQDNLNDQYKEHVDIKDKILIVTDTQASSGFNGLVAGDFANEYKRPVLILKDDGDYLKGSGRSYGGFDLKGFLLESGLCELVAGHNEAMGVHIKKDKLDTLKKYINNKIKNDIFSDAIEYDLELSAEDIDFDLIEQVNRFDYLTGNGFPKAKFKITNLFVNDSPKVLGRLNNTIKLSCDGLVLMKFKTTPDYMSDVGVFDSLEVVGSLNLNKWKNPRTKEVIVTKQVFIDDYKVV